MKKVKVDENNHDGFLKLIQQYNGEIKTLNQALEFCIERWDEITAPREDDEEKQLLREEIGVLKKRIEQLEKQLKEKDKIIESLREHDPKLLKEQMRIDWEREKVEKQKELERLKLQLKQREMEQKAATEIFKQLCKSGKLPENICQVEMGEFIRKSLGLDEILKEGGD